jgi:M6 family metalloprotease-like protein
VTHRVGLFRMAILSLGFICAGGRQAEAAPSTGEIETAEQPDGSKVDVRLFGDEFYIRGEGLDGYTLMRDAKTGFICYADLNADGSAWVSTGQIYRGRADAAGGAGGKGAAALDVAGSAGIAAATASSASAASILAERGIVPGLDLKPEARSRIRARARAELGLDGSEVEPMLGIPQPLRKSAADTVKRVTGVIILVDFQDVRADVPKQQIEEMAGLQGFKVNGNNGSIRDYFLDVSHGKFEYTLEVTEYYTAKNIKSHYDRADGYAGTYELIKETLLAVEARGYDFSKLTTSSSGTVKGVNVLFAGAAGREWAQGIWAHRGSITALNFNGVKVSGYMLAYIGSSPTIGTFIHESGHLLFGWPDLYDYDSDSRGTGAFCLMSGQNAKNPQPPNAWFRVGQGWEPIQDLKTVVNGRVSAPSNGRANFKYANPANSKELFVIENIARKGRWTNMPDDGLMIWHIDEAGDNSMQERTPTRHYEVSVVQADGKFDLERDVNAGGANDLFHAGNNAVFSGQTAPDSKWWNGGESGLSILNISAVKDTMTFDLQGVPVGLARRKGAPDRLGAPNGSPAEVPFAWRPDGRRVMLPEKGRGRAAQIRRHPSFSPINNGSRAATNRRTTESEER